MKCNVGKTDKVIRFILGIIIAAVGYYYKSWWGLAGVVLIFTALVSWCPIYFSLGLRTRKES